MTKRHLQSDKEREVNGQTAILAKRLAAAERERDEARQALAYACAYANEACRESLNDFSNPVKIEGSSLGDAIQRLSRKIGDLCVRLTNEHHTISVNRAAFREALAETRLDLQGAATGLHAAERERDEALDALRMRVIDAQFWAKQCEILVQERNEARAQLAEAQKTPDEWCRLLGVSIADPDGWRSEGDPPWEQPLGYDDFSRRAMRSSQLAPANPALLQEEIATLRAQLADAQRKLDEADEHLKIERQAKGVTTAKCLRCEYVRLASYLLCPMCCHVGEVENERNEARAQLAEARLSPWLLAETLEDTTAQHDPLPAPPIAEIDSLRAQLAEAQGARWILAGERNDVTAQRDLLLDQLAEYDGIESVCVESPDGHPGQVRIGDAVKMLAALRESLAETLLDLQGAATGLHAAERERDELQALLADGQAISDSLRQRGWSVAVHNDYYTDGRFHTFWLLTNRFGQFVKGEGPSDWIALGYCDAEANVIDATMHAPPIDDAAEPEEESS